MKSLKRLRVWIIIIICVGVLLFLRPIVEPFALTFSATTVVDDIKDVGIRTEILQNYDTNCRIVYDRINEINGVAVKLDAIKNEINEGAISVQFALEKLKAITSVLDCRTNTTSTTCKIINDAIIPFERQLQSPNVKNDTTIAGVNATINEEYENVMAYSKLVNMLSISLNCNNSLRR